MAVIWLTLPHKNLGSSYLKNEDKIGWKSDDNSALAWSLENRTLSQAVITDKPRSHEISIWEEYLNELYRCRETPHPRAYTLTCQPQCYNTLSLIYGLGVGTNLKKNILHLNILWTF